MMQPTSLIVIRQSDIYLPNPTVIPVDICDQCGGLFTRPGVAFFGLPHNH